MDETRPRFPSNKISATFLEFLEPVMEVMHEPKNDQETEHILMIGFTVWNAVVFADAVGNDKPLTALEEVMTREPHTRPLIGRLIERKRTEYSHDHRLIGNYELKTVDGEVRLQVEARSPYPNDKK